MAGADVSRRPPLRPLPPRRAQLLPVDGPRRVPPPDDRAPGGGAPRRRRRVRGSPFPGNVRYLRDRSLRIRFHPPRWAANIIADHASVNVAPRPLDDSNEQDVAAAGAGEPALNIVTQAPVIREETPAQKSFLRDLIEIILLALAIYIIIFLLVPTHHLLQRSVPTLQHDEYHLTAYIICYLHHHHQ